MADGFNIKLLGDKALERKFRRLDTKTQGKVLRPALREHAKKKVIPRIVANVPVDTGELKAALQKMKVKSAGKRGVIRLGPAWPTRDELGISPGDKYFYPTAVEFGHGNIPAKPYLRPAIDNHVNEDRSWLAWRIGKGIVKEFAKR